jgi:hypothetical protein
MVKTLLKSTALALALATALAGSAQAVTDYSGWSREQLESEEARLTEELAEVETWLTFGMSSADLYASDEEVTPLEDLPQEAEEEAPISLITAAPVQDLSSAGAQDLTAGAPQDLTVSAPAPVEAAPADAQLYTGSGDYVLTLEDVPDRYLLEVTGNAQAKYFGIVPYSLSGNRQFSLVGTTDAFHGRVYEPSQGPVMLEISAVGDWSVEVLPLDAARSVRKGETITGSGPDVIIVDPSAGEPVTAAVTGNASAKYFGITPYDANGNRLFSLIGTTDVYSGTVMLQKSPRLLCVEAVGDWSITLQ